MLIRFIKVTLFASAPLLLTPIVTGQHHSGEETVTKAIAVLHSTEGSSVRGTVTFTRVENGIHVVVDISGLSPGSHGFHIHQYGDCSTKDATSAGGHFNPEDKPHGAREIDLRHIGDLGNLMADNNGITHANFVDSMITFEGPNSIMGRSVIVHLQADDFTTQPTGAAGARVACGVIGVAEE